MRAINWQILQTVNHGLDHVRKCPVEKRQRVKQRLRDVHTLYTCRHDTVLLE